MKEETAEEIQKALDGLHNILKDNEALGIRPIFDFKRPLPHICDWCHYPFNASMPAHISWIDCPEHRPGHMKYFDRAQKIIRKVLNAAD